MLSNAHSTEQGGPRVALAVSYGTAFVILNDYPNIGRKDCSRRHTQHRIISNSRRRLIL